MEIKLGSTVKDEVTGFTGIATQKREMLSGNVQIVVQPKNKEGENTLPDGHYIDIHMLTVVDAGVSAKATKPTAELIPLGSKVKDKVTGMEGTVTSRATFINGCIYYDLTPKKKTTMFDSNPDPQFVDGIRLEVMKDAALNGFPPATVTPGVRPDGGPSMKLKREVVRR